MTIDKAVEIVNTIKFPNARIFIDGSGIPFFTRIIIDWSVLDSSFPHNPTHVFSQMGFFPEHYHDSKAIYDIVLRMVVEFLEHDAREKLTINGTLPYNPHIEEHHQSALDEQEAIKSMGLYLVLR